MCNTKQFYIDKLTTETPEIVPQSVPYYLQQGYFAYKNGEAIKCSTRTEALKISKNIESFRVTNPEYAEYGRKYYEFTEKCAELEKTDLKECTKNRLNELYTDNLFDIIYSFAKSEIDEDCYLSELTDMPGTFIKYLEFSEKLLKPKIYNFTPNYNPDTHKRIFEQVRREFNEDVALIVVQICTINYTNALNLTEQDIENPDQYLSRVIKISKQLLHENTEQDIQLAIDLWRCSHAWTTSQSLDAHKKTFKELLRNS